VTKPSMSHDELHSQAYRYALAWGQQQSGQLQTLELLPCTSQLFRAEDRAWVAHPSLASGIEVEPFLVARREGQFRAQMLGDFVLSIASHLEALWCERGHADATIICDWHPPLDDFLLPELAGARERDDAWCIEFAFQSAADEAQLSTAFSVVWFHYEEAVEVCVIHTQTIPFSTETVQEGE